jgi:hypothetical protein
VTDLKKTLSGGTADDGKWMRSPLKSSWYDDHYGFGATPMEIVENRLRMFAEGFQPHNEEEIASAEVERFFDLFEQGH